MEGGMGFILHWLDVSPAFTARLTNLYFVFRMEGEVGWYG